MLDDYAQRFPGEAAIVERFRALLADAPACYHRSRLDAHLTASAWVSDPPRNAVLLLHHKKLNKWLQPGGHADGDTDLIAVAQREVMEETGVIASPSPLPTIFDLDIHPIPARIGKLGEEPAHEHFDVRFHMTADSALGVVGNHESNDLGWFTADDLESRTRQPSMRRMLEKWWQLL